MNNYEYIIASLPVPSPDSQDLDPEALIGFIRSQCSPSDCAFIDSLLDSFDGKKLDFAYYSRALGSKNRFLREFVLFDLQMRNVKVEYLNKVLGRPEGLDIMPVPGREEENGYSFEAAPAVMAVLEQSDILSRERGLDKLLWEKAEELTRMDLFDIDVILSFIAKLKITVRWNKLDPRTGREMFRKLVQEIRNTR